MTGTNAAAVNRNGMRSLMMCDVSPLGQRDDIPNQRPAMKGPNELEAEHAHQTVVSMNRRHGKHPTTRDSTYGVTYVGHFLSGCRTKATVPDVSGGDRNFAAFRSMHAGHRTVISKNNPIQLKR